MNDDPFKNRAEDFLNKGTKAAISLLPGVGGPLSEFITFVIGDPAQERRDDFIRSTAERLIDLEAKHDELSREALRDNEQFQATFIQATQLANMTADAEKKKMLQNAILNSAIIEMSEVVRHIFMQNLERSTPLHARLLGLVDNFEGNPAAIASAKGMMTGSQFVIIQAAMPELVSNRELFDRATSDLRAMGLIDTDSFNVTMSGSGLLNRRSTPLGRSFLCFINDP
jgi:hypothetical protein